MASSFATEAFTLLGIGIVVITLRVVARATSVGVRSFQFDDYLMCVAAVRATSPNATSSPYSAVPLLLCLADRHFREAPRSYTPSKQQPHTSSAHGGWGLRTMV